MAKTIKGRVQHPVYTAAALKAKNPVLLEGEIVYESDTTLHKVGDGVTPWNALAYARGGGFEDGIPAEQINQDSSHRFVTDAEKSAWNDKAAKDLSNVSIGKQFADNGYYKAPDGLMFQWGSFTANANKSGKTVYFPTTFAYTPYAVLTTPMQASDSPATVAVAFVLNKTTAYFTAKGVWANSGSQGYGQENYRYIAVGRWK